MASQYSRQGEAKPITTKGRLLISACIVLASLVLGIGIAAAIYQSNRERIQRSDIMGYVFCGTDQHIGDVNEGKSRRMICRDAVGVEVSARNNFIFINMALPFILFFAVPGVMLAWIINLGVPSRK